MENVPYSLFKDIQYFNVMPKHEVNTRYKYNISLGLNSL